VPTLPPDAPQRDATGRFDRARHLHSLKPDQTAKLFKRFANKYGEPAPSRQILDIVKARTSNHTLPLAARSNHGLPDPHQLAGPITTKAVLDGVNHGFQCHAPAVLKEALAQNKHSLHIDARTYQSMQNFACLMVNGDLLSTP
jgi:hypothetical protein